MKLNVIYEDNHIIVVEKPANIPSQKDNTNDIDMLTIIKDYLKEKYDKKGNVYLGLVHRLDRPVGGIMVFAKTSKAASRLSDQIRNNEFKKTYIAIIDGVLKQKQGTWKDYLIKNEKTNITTTTTKEKGKEAILDYKVIDEKNNLSMLKINLKTGRSHQIRVQTSSRGYPIVGDSKYGKNEEKINIALFAYELSFIHPTKKEQMTFKLNLPNRYPYNIFNL